jgi:glutamate dehydrogenase
MSPATQAAGDELIDAVVGRIRERMSGDDAELAVAFTREYLRVTPGSDITRRDPADVYAATLGLFRRVQVRPDSLPSVWVSAPTIDQDGWQSPHSVVDLVADDRPFLVDSVLQTLRRLGLGVHLLVNSVMGVERDGRGELVGVGRPAPSGRRESMVHIEVDRFTDPDRVAEVEGAILAVLEEVTTVASDWQEMRTSFLEDALRVEAFDAEGARLLRWLAEDRFVFLGGVRQGGDPERLGLCLFDSWAEATVVPCEEPGVRIDEAALHSPVHRDAPLVRVVVSLPDGEGCRCHCYAGLFTNEVYSAPVTELPVVAGRVREVIERAGFVAGGHNERRLRYLLEQYPREEVFQIDSELLFDHAMGMLHLRDHQEVRIFLRRSRDARSASCLIFAPRDRFDTQVRLQMLATVRDAFDAEGATFSTVLGESPFARLHVKVHAPPDRDLAEVEVGELEAQLTRVTRTWADEFRAALVDHHGEDVGLARFAAWNDAFPTGYRARHRPAQAVLDVETLRSLGDDDLAVEVARPLEVGPGELRIKLIRTGGPLTLSEVLPVLHDLGVTVLQEHPYELVPADGRRGWLYEVAIRVSGEDPGAERRRRFEEAFRAVWDGHAESDGFGALVLSAGVTWREVAVLRAYRRYLRQIGSTFSQTYYEQTLARHPELTRLVLELFRARFDPDLDGDRAAMVAATEERLDESLDAIASLDEDRMLRSFRVLVSATVRTNAFRDPWPEALAFKFDPSLIADLPAPRPAHEIWVYSPRTRGSTCGPGRSPVAGCGGRTGGRTIAPRSSGLMKAQSVKNAVIVPVGAKGGFVAKRAARAGPGGVRAEVAACYRIFVGAARCDRRSRRRARCAPGPGGPLGRRRPLPGGRRRQGHGHLLRPRQRVAVAAGVLVG